MYKFDPTTLIGKKRRSESDPHSKYRVETSEGEAEKRRCLYAPEPKPERLHKAGARNILYGGAAGGGKSHTLRWHFILACLKTPGFKALILRRKFKDLELSQLISVAFEVPDGLAKYNGQRKRLEFPNKSFIQFGHCHRMDDLKDYMSSEWDAIGVDEAGELTPEMLRLLPWRLRTTKKGVIPQYILCANPGGPGHLFLKSRFIDKQVDSEDDPAYRDVDYKFIPAYVTDNPYIDDEYIRRLLSLSEQERRAYLYGDWDSFVGQVFREWDSSVHVVDWEPPADWRWAAGMDWGMRKPGWFGLFAAGPDGDVICRHEIYFKNKHAHVVGELIGHLCSQYPVEYIAADEQMWNETGISAPTLAEECQNGIQSVYGENVFAPQLVAAAHGPGSRYVSQQLMHRYLQFERDEDGEIQPWNRPLLVFHRDCKHAIRTIPSLTHDLDKPEEVDTEGEDHPYDGTRYYLNSRPKGPDDEPEGRTQHTHPGFTPTGERRMSQYERALRGFGGGEASHKPWRQSTEFIPYDG